MSAIGYYGSVENMKGKEGEDRVFTLWGLTFNLMSAI